MAKKSLGQKIRELRTKKGLTQIELAEGICTPSMVSQCESDRARPSYRILSAFAEKLDTSLESLLTNIDLQLEFTSNYKMAKSMVAAKEYTAAIPFLQDLLDAPRSLISPVEVLMLLCECFLGSGALEKAQRALDELKEQYLDAKDHHMLALIYNYMGLLEVKKRQLEISVFHFENALNELSKMEHPDPFVQAEIILNLGHVREKQGKINQAIELYHQAQKLYTSTETPQQMAVVYSDMARSYQRLNQPEKSIEYSDRAFALFRSTHDRYMGIKSQMTSAIANGQLGREEESIRTLETVIKKFQEMGKTEDVGIAYVELAKLQVALDDDKAAVESCRIARSLLPELHSHQAWAHRILGEIEVRKGNHDEAIRRFGMAGHCFKLAGEIGEWASTMGELSRLREQRNEYQEAYRIISEVQIHTQAVLNERGIVL